MGGNKKNKMKTCNKCQEIKPSECFTKDKQANDGLGYTCKDCLKKARKAYKKNGGLDKLIDQSHKPWFQCSSCLAAIGLGHKKASQILCHLSPGQIYGAWRRGGVSVQTPACGSWRIYASRVAKGWPADRQQTESEIAYEKGRLADIKEASKKGFTWAYIWTKEKASRKALEKYHAMTPDERKRHNKRCAKNHKKRMMNDPDAKKRQLEHQQKWRENNRDKCNEYSRRWVRKNPERQRELNRISRKKRVMLDPSFKLQQNMRNRYRKLMKMTKNGGSTRHVDDLGCHTKDFNHYLESKFTKGMTWDNYGTYWHLDHILPCASFNHEDEKQRKQCWHWTNFQPLEAEQNVTKSDNIERPQMKLLLEYA